MKIQVPSKKNLLITTGDADGIGFEVAAKAISATPPSFFKVNRVCIFVTEDFQRRYLTLLKKKFSITLLNKASSAFSVKDLDNSSKNRKPNLFLVVASDSPADWIYNLSKICLSDSKNTALVTGPLSKTLIKSAGYSAVGHTEILSLVSGVKPLYMGFVGKFFNVVLLTGHIPLTQVSNTLRDLDWAQIHSLSRRFLKGVCGREKKAMALVALNPHAGEHGMISNGEEDFLKQQLDILADPILEGPLVPDAAFLKPNWKKYGLYLCPYHDQGLIPFKTIHGQDSGVHVTLGLPFVRTSVDHGTAKEIFGKNQANPNSMKEALQLARKLLAN